MMGLFDRPAPLKAIETIWAHPDILGLTSELKVSYNQWKFAIKDLRNMHLLADKDINAPDVLDCHPLIREHFGEKLRRNNPIAWKEANRRLFYYYKNLPVKELPDTLDEMEPLFASVMHGCQADLHQEAFYDVLWKRIKREGKYYSTQRLGAYGSDLAALSNFFEVLWSRPISILKTKDQANVLAWAGFHLRNLGRLTEAIEPLKAGLEARIRIQSWGRDTAVSAGNLSELYLMIGDINQAIIYARQGVEFADKGTDPFWKGASRATLADALHQAGDFQEAERIFRAISPLRDLPNSDPYPYSIWGFRANDLYLTQGLYNEVKSTAQESIARAIQESRSLLDIALNKIILGRALVSQSQRLEASDIRSIETLFNQAVEDLRKANTQGYLFRGLLARAMFYRLQREFNKARNDLEEAKEIAELGSMKIYLADYYLEMCRLKIVEGQIIEAKNILSNAKTILIMSMYHRHDKNVTSLEKKLHDATNETALNDFSPQTISKIIEAKNSTSSPTSILFLAADPKDTSRLRLGEELREIQEKMQLARLREKFELHQRMSIRPADISQAFLDIQPNIVHFSGHGASSGELCFENQIGEAHAVKPEVLTALFEQFNNSVKCVILNACYSEIQANAIVQHIEFVIGMSQSIGDKAAIAFSIGFYQGLGAGRTIEDAYKLGCVQIGLQGIPEQLTPVLLKRERRV